MRNQDGLEMNSSNPLHDDNHDDDIHDDENSLINNHKVIRNKKWTWISRTILLIVIAVAVITIIDGILLYVNKFVNVDVNRVDLYLQPEVLQFGDAQIKVNSRKTFNSFLHKVEVKADSTSCLINYQNPHNVFLLSKVTLRTPVHLSPLFYSTASDNLNIGFSDVGYDTLRDMMFNAPHYRSGKPVITCDINFDVFAFGLIPLKNMKYSYDSSVSGSSDFNALNTLKAIFESGSVDNGRRLSESSSNFNAPLKFYDYEYSLDKNNSINQFALSATSKIDSSNCNVPFQVGIHVPALKLYLGPSKLNPNTNKNEYSNSYVFETEQSSVDLISPEFSAATFKANLTCIAGDNTCSLIYPLSFIFGGMVNGTAMATADFVNENNLISNFLGQSHKMIFQKYNESRYFVPSRSLSSISNEEPVSSRNLAKKVKSKPTTRPSRKPSPKPSERPSHKPTFHPTRVVLPTIENFWYSNIYFDDWQLFKASLFFTDIGADLKIDVAVDTFKIVEANTTLKWTNEVPLITSAVMNINILDGYIIGKQNLFLNELDEFVTESVNLLVNSRDVLNLNMIGKYYNLNPSVPVSDNFEVDFNSIKLLINNETVATAAVNLTVDAVADGFMTVSFAGDSPRIDAFLGIQWNFDLSADQNYLGLKSVGNLINQNPMWNAETYIVYTPSKGSIDEPSPYTYSFNLDGSATTTKESYKLVESDVCQISVNLGDKYYSYWYYYWYPDAYTYSRMADVLYETLSLEIENLEPADVQETTLANSYYQWCYSCRSRTNFNFRVIIPKSNGFSCFTIEKVLKDNAYTYSNSIRFKVSSFLGPFLSINTSPSYSTYTNKKIFKSSIQPFSYSSRGDGTYGFSGFNRFGIIMSSNSVQANNSTLTFFQGGLNADLDSTGFLTIDFIEKNNDHFNFKTNNEFTWDINNSEGDITMKSNGSWFRAVDWNFDGDFGYMPDTATARKDYSLNFDLDGNTYTVKDSEVISSKITLVCYSYVNVNNVDDIQGSLNRVKDAFFYAYNIQDVNVEVSSLNTQYFQGGYGYDNNWYSDPYSPFWYYSPYQQMSVRVTVLVDNQIECDYLNLHASDFYQASYNYLNTWNWPYFNSYNSWEYESSSAFLESHPYSISKSISGNYYDGSTDVVFTVNSGNLTINGNDYEYSADIMYDNKNLAAGFIWGEQLESSLILGWDFGSDQGTVSMGATTYLTNAVGISDVASTASLNFEYSPAESDANTQFKMASTIEGHGIDYYKKQFVYGYWDSQSILAPCSITIKVQNSNLAMYSSDYMKESIIDQLNYQLDQRGYGWLLNVDSVEITSFREYYIFVIGFTQKQRYANFQCYYYTNYFSIYDIYFDSVGNLGMAAREQYVSSSCPANYYYTSTYEISGSSCYWDWWGNYYCNNNYDYYYECRGSWEYVEYREEKAHTLSFNISANSNGRCDGSFTDTWYCEADEVVLQVNDKKAIDAELGVYNMLPTLSPTLSPSRSFAPTLRPTISPYLGKISPTLKPSRKPSPKPSLRPSPRPTLVPTLAGSDTFGEHTVVVDFKEKLSKIEIGVVSKYVGSINDFTLTLEDFSFAVDKTVITENAIGGKISYQIPAKEIGKVKIESWDKEQKTTVYNLANAVEWAKKDENFYLGLDSSFVLNDVVLYDAGFNTSIVNKPKDLLLGLGTDLTVGTTHIFDINAITEWSDYTNRIGKYKPTSKPTSKPTKRKKPTSKPTKRPSKRRSPSNAAPNKPRGQPNWSHRFPNIAPSRKYIYTTHSPSKSKKLQN